MSTPNPAPERIETSLQRRPEELLKRLIDFDPRRLPVISLYLDGRVDENGKHDFGPFVRKELTARARTYRAESAERASFDEDFRRIERFLENEVRLSAQGIAIFACAGANDFFEVGEFDATFNRHQLFVSDRPHLYPPAPISISQTDRSVPPLRCGAG